MQRCPATAMQKHQPKHSLKARLSLNSNDLLHRQVCELAWGDESTTTLRKQQGAHMRTLKDPDLSASPSAASGRTLGWFPLPRPSPDPPPGFPLLRLNYSVGYRIGRLTFRPAGFVQVSPKNLLFSYILHYTTLITRSAFKSHS